MKRKLIRQMANEWRSNIWLAIELLIVSVVAWYIIDSLYVNYSIFNEPRGFNTEHCYLINYDQLNDRSSDYKEYASREDASADFLRLIERLADRPEVEAVGVGQNSYLYNGSNSGTQLQSDSISTEHVLRRIVSPGFPIVFRIEGVNGESPEELAALLRDNPGKLLASDNLFNTIGIDHVKEFIGKDFSNWANRDTTQIIAAYKVVRYDDYHPAEISRSVMWSVPEKYYFNMMNELFVRVKDNMDHNFIENLMKDAQHNLRFGNIYISNVISFDDIRESHQRGDETSKRNLYVVMVFLAINIFLGLLGTFWFRTRTRIPEIAIRKANGAKSIDIFRRVIGEGEILLLMVTPIAIVVDWLLAHYEFNVYYGGYFVAGRFIACVLITMALMALMILLGTAIPAYRAMKLQPAKALKEE